MIVDKSIAAQTKRGVKIYKIEIEIDYIPFPSEEARREAYHTYARLFLRARERMLKEAKKTIALSYKI